MRFVATSDDGTRMEAFDMSDHPYFVGVQYHPEYLTRPLSPSPPYLGLLLACLGQFTLNFDTTGLDQRLYIQNQENDRNAEKMSVMAMR